MFIPYLSRKLYPEFIYTGRLHCAINAKYVEVYRSDIHENKRRACFSVGEDDCVGFSLKWHHLVRQLAGCESPIDTKLRSSENVLSTK
jgi:hypothetical protein